MTWYIGADCYLPMVVNAQAPYPEQVPEAFIRCFCPHGGMVCDPFVDSGTTAVVAVRWQRSFLGCDIRQEMVALVHRRVEQETPVLFAE